MTQKKQLIILGIALVSALVIFNIYFFGFKSLENNAYKKGVLVGIEQGKIQIMSVLISQWNATRSITLPAINLDGSTTTITLIPK